MLPRKYRHCLYEMADEVFHYGRPRRLSYEQLLQVVFFISSLRILYMAYLMAHNFPAWHAYEHDLMLSYLRLNAGRFDYSLLLALYLFNVVYTSLEYWIYSSVDERAEVWKWWWTVTVRNQQLYNQALYSSLEVEAIQEVRRREIAFRLQKDSLFGVLPGALLTPLTGLLARWEVFYSLEGADLGRLQEGGDCSLPLRPKISWPLRRQTLRIILIAEYLTYYFQLFVVAIYWSVIALVVLTYPNWSSHSVLGIAYGFCEVAGAFYVFFRLIRFLNLFTVTTLLGTVTFTGHLLESQRSIEKLIAKYAQLRLPLPVRFRPLLDQFFDDHSLTAFLVLEGSDRLFGDILLGFLYTQIPVNVIFLRRIILFSSANPTLTLVLTIACAVQLAVCAGVLLPFAWCQAIYHSPKRFIFRLQAATWGHAWLATKLNYEDLYGRLIRGPKISLSIGPISEVTYFSVFEFLLSYIAYLLLAFGTDL